ncbi:MAG: FAD-dependent oxidoreductase [Alphaproteobacteria bacterium]|nr:FAD-dependent oxidoreductase [Alphaproteobacteria bacterium]
MKKYNLVVVGGGLSGVAAAVSAAREGLEVLLVEASGNLGGALSEQLVFPFMPFHVNNPETGEIKYLSDGLFRKICLSQEKYEGKSLEFVKEFKKEYIKIILDEMLEEAKVDVLFHSFVYDAQTENRNIKSVSVATTKGSIQIRGDFFVDASGDGNLMAFSGCSYLLGRESDNLCQPMTTCFDVCGVDLEQFHKDKPMLQELYTKRQKEGKIINPRENILTFEGLGENILHFNTTRVVKHNPVDPFELSKAEMIARKQVCEMYEFLKANSKAFKHSTLVNSASHIGIRESRKLIGEYVLKSEDLINCVEFPDAIALGMYPIDIHNPEGTGTVMHHLKEGEYYQIPYRCLVPKELDNMLVAGRNLSATHEAHSAVRIMPICCCMGEAAGTAIGEAYNTNTNVHTVDIQSVRRKLKEYGAAIE